MQRLTRELVLQIHGSLSLEAVAVTEQLDWKLWGFDFLTEINSVESFDAALRYAPKLVSAIFQLIISYSVHLREPRCRRAPVSSAHPLKALSVFE